MGRVKQGRVSEKPLTVKNLGDSPLVIESLASSCPCATVSPLSQADSTVPPGDSRVLSVRYTADERAGDSGATIEIHSNDPDLPVIVADLNVFIEMPVVIYPPDGVHWGLAPRGFPLNKALMIGPGDIAKDIELMSVRCSVPGVRIESERVEEADRRYLRLTFALGADLPLGSLDAELIARVRVGEEVTDLSIPFRGNVVGDLLLSPPAIVSPKTAYSQGQRISEITVRSSTGGIAPEVVGAMAVGPVKALIEKKEVSDRHVIGVYAAQNAPSGPQSATVYVMTTSRDEPIVAVPIYFRMGSSVACEPDRLVLHEAGPAREIRVRHLQGGTLRIKNLRFEADSLYAEVREAEQETADRPAIVSAGSARNFNPQKRSTILVIETDAPGAERLIVPVMVLP